MRRRVRQQLLRRLRRLERRAAATSSTIPPPLFDGILDDPNRERAFEASNAVGRSVPWIAGARPSSRGSLVALAAISAVGRSVPWVGYERRRRSRREQKQVDYERHLRGCGILQLFHHLFDFGSFSHEIPFAWIHSKKQYCFCRRWACEMRVIRVLSLSSANRVILYTRGVGPKCYGASKQAAASLSVFTRRPAARSPPSPPASARSRRRRGPLGSALAIWSRG